MKNEASGDDASGVWSDLRPFAAPVGGLGAAVRARASRCDGGLRFEYWFEGSDRFAPPTPTDRLSADEGRAWLAQGASERSDGLWREACWEAFVSPLGASEYWEFNFSPMSGWNVYRFDRCREGMAEEQRAPSIRSRFAHAASVASAGLSAGASSLIWSFEARLAPELAQELAGPLEASLTAVLKASDSDNLNFVYLALAHSGAKPDFHLRASFAMRLPAASSKGTPA